MSEPQTRTTDKSIPALLRELLDELRALIRDEVRLAKTETEEKLAVVTRNLASIAVGAALALSAVVILATAINRGVTSLFAQFMGVEVAVWLAPLVVAVLLALVGYSMIKKGTGTIKRQSPVPEKTVRTVKEDKQWIQEKTS